LVVKRHFKLKKLLEFGESRYFEETESPILPLDLDLDFEQYIGIETTQALAGSYFPNGIPKWNREFVNDSIGKPFFCFLNSLCVIEIRKNVPDSNAMALLQRLWLEHAQTLTKHLTSKRIVATMQAIALSGKDPIEQAICYSGITYAKMMKMYEADRFFTGFDSDEKYPRQHSKRTYKSPQKGLGSFGVISQDLARNLNADLYFLSKASDFSGVMLQELIERSAEQHNVFSRLDNARIEMSGSELLKRRFSFLNSRHRAIHKSEKHWPGGF